MEETTNENTPINSASITGNGNIIIQDANGSTIIINPENPEELKKIITELGSKIADLPTEVLKIIEDKQDLSQTMTVGANIYLTIYQTFTTYNYSAIDISFGITITNLSKEHRYFNFPFFKVTPKFDLPGGRQHDTFQMLSDTPDAFPKRLEYGEPFSVKFSLQAQGDQMYRDLLAKDPNAIIQCFATTTVGEIYESNKIEIKKLVNSIDEVR